MSFLAAGTVIAQPPREEPSRDQPPRQTGPDAIVQQQPSFLVRAEVNHATRVYGEDDGFSLRVTSEEDAYLYVVYQQADGKLYQVFPNSSQGDNRVRARQAVQVPAADDGFRWRIGPPFGKEIVKVIASKAPIDPLADPNLRKGFFNELSARQLKGVEFALGERDAEGWAEDQIEIVTQPREQPAAPTRSKRFGVFFGVANYEFNAEVELASEGKRHLNLRACHRDARQMADVLRELGRLTGVRTYTNEQATRNNMEDAITGWLPKVSRPGDTVLIYFSGHGMHIPDDNGDEADGQDELLVPYDYLGPEILLVLKERQEQGKLEARLAPRVKAALSTVRRAASPEKGLYTLMRQTTVSDDLFAHWMQRLAGRQIVVILDSCNSGGFATLEKGGPQGAKSNAVDQTAAFDFLDQEFTRLKDLGQNETALLAACHAQELAGIRVQGDLSIMTKYLLEGILAAPASLTLEQGFDFCRVGMHGYFEEVNRALAAVGKPPVAEQRPVLDMHCAKAPLLKP